MVQANPEYGVNTPSELNSATGVRPPKKKNPVAPPPEPDKAEDWYGLIGKRVEKMPTDFYLHSPDVAAQLAASQLSDKNILRLSKNYVPMHQWIQQQNTLGGVPGALINARLKAINIQDPALRVASLTMINDIARLPEADQQMFLAYAQAPTADSTASATAAIGQLLPGATTDNGMVNVSSENVTIQQVAMIESAFPALQGKIHFSEAGVNLEDFRIDLTNNILNRAFSTWGLQAPQITGDVNTGGVVMGEDFRDLQPTKAAFGLGMAALNYTNPVGLGISVGLPALGAGADLAAQALPSWAVKAQATSAISFAGSKTRVLESFMAEGQHSAGAWVADLLHKTPGTEEYDSTANIAGGLIIAAALHLGGESLGALKTVRTEVDFGAAANLGLPLDEGVAGTMDAIRASIEKQGIKGTIIHPLRVLADPAVRAFIYNLKSIPPDTWVKGGFANKVFDSAERFLKENPATAQARMLQHYPTMDVRLIDNLLRAGGKEFMPDVAINYYHGNDILTKAEVMAKQVELNTLRATGPEPVGLPLLPQPLETATEFAGITRGQRYIDFRELPSPETATAEEAANVYHITDMANLGEIQTGGLLPKMPAIGGPEGVYFGDSLHDSSMFIPPGMGERVPIALRVKRGALDLFQKRPDTPETYSEVAVPPENIEVLTPEGWRPISEINLNELDPVQKSVDAARILELQSQIASAALAHIEVVFPGGNTLPELLHRVIIHPETPMEHMLNRILNPGAITKEWSNKVFDTHLNVSETSWLGKLTDKIDYAPKLYDISSSNAPLDAIDQNVTLLNRYLKRLGWTEEEITVTQARFLAVKSKQGFYDSMDLLSKEIDARLPVNTPLAVRKAMTQFWHRSQDQYMLGYRDPVTGLIEPLVPGKTVAGSSDALPSAPLEFAGHVKLPNMDLVSDVTSTLRRISRNSQSELLRPEQVIRKAKQLAKNEGIDIDTATKRVMATNGSGWLGRHAAASTDFARSVLHMSTSVLKPVSLIFKIPSIILRKELDEGAGNSLSPGIVGSTKTSSQIIEDAIGDVDPGVIGSGVQSMFEHTDQVAVIDNVPLADLTTRGKANDPAVWASRVNELRFLNSDPMIRRFIAEGLDIDTMRALLGGDASYRMVPIDEVLAMAGAYEKAADGTFIFHPEWMPAGSEYKGPMDAASMAAEQARLTEKIRTEGFDPSRPVIVYNEPGTGLTVGEGLHRLEGARAAGKKMVPVKTVDASGRYTPGVPVDIQPMKLTDVAQEDRAVVANHLRDAYKDEYGDMHTQPDEAGQVARELLDEIKKWEAGGPADTAFIEAAFAQDIQGIIGKSAAPGRSTLRAIQNHPDLAGMSAPAPGYTRIFRGGALDPAADSGKWWTLDYKTAKEYSAARTDALGNDVPHPVPLERALSGEERTAGQVYYRDVPNSQLEAMRATNHNEIQSIADVTPTEIADAKLAGYTSDADIMDYAINQRAEATPVGTGDMAFERDHGDFIMKDGVKGASVASAPRFGGGGMDAKTIEGLPNISNPAADPELAQLFADNTAHSLEQANDGKGMSVNEWLFRLKSTIEDTTLHDTELLNFARTGRVYVGGNVDDVTAAKYGRWQDEEAALSVRLSELAPSQVEERAALVAEQKAVLNRIHDVEAAHLVAHPQSKGVSIAALAKTQERALANYLHGRWDEGTLTMPQNIRVTRYTSDGGFAPASITEHMNSWATKFSTSVYRRFEVIGKMEAKYAKGSFYKQRAWQYREEYLAGGSSPKQATALAQIKAGNVTRDMMYDMSARSSIERSTRNVFWYAPVTGELMHRWLYAIPAQQGWIPGLVINAAKAVNYFNLAKELGIIHQDANGEWTVPIPGAGKFLSFITAHQIRGPHDIEIPLESLSHLSLNLPSLGTLPGFALTQLAKHNQAAYDIAQVLDPYGQSTEIIPSAIRYAAGAFGIKIPDLNPDYIDSQYNQIHNQALQFAVSQLGKEGDVAPDRADFNDDAAYLAKWTAWHDRVNTAADQYARGMFFFKTLQSTIVPGTISMTTPEKEAYQEFFQNEILPQYDSPDYAPGNATSEKIKAELLKWYAGHPGSQAFMISYNWYTGKEWHPPVEATSDEAFRMLYLHGVKDTMTPEQYMEVLPALMSKNAYDAAQNAQLQQIAPNSLGPDVQATTLLKRWGERRQVIQDSQEKWQTYLLLHPDADGAITTADANIAKQYGYDSEASGLQWIQNTLLGLAKLSDLATGVSGMADKEYRATVSTLRAAQSQYFDSIGGQVNASPLAKNLAWYFDKVSKYSDATEPLYNQAVALSDAGQDASAIYAQITSIKNQYKDLTHGGVTYPSIDEFFFGSKTKQEQKYALANWATKPISWLSDWQREKLGYKPFKNEDAFWQAIDAVKGQTNSIIQYNAISPGSSQYDAYQAQSDAQQQAIAASYGPDAVTALGLESAAPMIRLQTVGFGAGNVSWQTAVNTASAIAYNLTSAGLSARSYSQESIQQKIGFEQWIQSQQIADPEFKALMTQLSFAIPAADSPGGQRTGVPLYEAIFFGQFSKQFIPAGLLSVYAQGTGAV